MEFLKRYLQGNESQFDHFKGKVQLKLNWIYGFRSDDTLKNFAFHYDRQGKNNPKLIYFVANVVVIYYYKENRQTHYIQHKSKVSAIALARNSNLVATGDSGKQPYILIWNVNDLETKYTIMVKHSHDVFALEFLDSDQYLVSMGLKSNTPVHLYHIETGQTI